MEMKYLTLVKFLYNKKRVKIKLSKNLLFLKKRICAYREDKNLSLTQSITRLEVFLVSN